jgi:hypothetical protein
MKSSSSKSPLDIAFYKGGLKSSIKGWEELGLRNVGYRASDQMLYFLTISILQY